jgi:hypothetical protein
VKIFAIEFGVSKMNVAWNEKHWSDAGAPGELVINGDHLSKIWRECVNNQVIS